MKKRKMNHTSIILAGFLFFLITNNIKAQYIDPGTGSYIIQFLIAGFLAFIFFFKNPKALLKVLKDKLFKKKNV